MAFNSSGLFVRLYNFVSDKAAGIKIRADRFDAELDGIATGLSTCITKDGQTTITADIPFNGKKITGLGDATAATDALNRQAGDARYKWVTLVDSTLGAAAQAFQFSLSGYQRVRVVLVGIPNAAAATDFNVFWYSSTNNGSSFDTAANNYYNVVNKATSSAVAADGGLSANGVLTATSHVVDKDSPQAAFRLDFIFDAGSASKLPRLQGACSFFDGTNYRLHSLMGQRQSAAKVTDLRITADVASAFATGSTLLVEAC